MVYALPFITTMVSAFPSQEETLPESSRAQLVDHMVMVHQSVRSFSTRFLEELRRHNYVTPKVSGQYTTMWAVHHHMCIGVISVR